MADLKDWFVPAASGIAALLGVVNAFLNRESTLEIDRLKTQIVRIGEERKFASDIMTRFDNVVVDPKADRDVRISRLQGLMALATLMTRTGEDKGGLDTEGILTVIRAQTDAYKSEVAELTKTATPAQADQLQSQYVRLNSIGESATKALTKLAKADAEKPSLLESVTSTAPSVSKPTALEQTKVDIFWCAGRAESANALAGANALLAARPLTAKKPWQVRALTPEKQASGFYNITGQVIRYDSAAERGVAEALARLAGSDFVVQLAAVKPTPGYLSAFICPG